LIQIVDSDKRNFCLFSTI